MTSQPGPGAPTDRVRLGIVGLGAVAQAVHLPLIERLRDAFSIGAIADLSPTLTAAVGERYRVAPERRFGTVEELVGAGDLDGLLILTSGSHGAPVVTGLDAGLAVFAEKPLAFTVAETEAIGARLGSDEPPRLQVGYMKLYDPAVLHARRVAADRGFGAPRAIEVTVLHPTSESQLAHARLLPPPSDVPDGRSLDPRGCDRTPASCRARRPGGSGVRTPLQQHPVGEHRPRAGARAGLRRRSDGHRQPHDVARGRLAAVGRADRRTSRPTVASRSAGTSCLITRPTARKCGWCTSERRSSSPSRRRICSTARRSCGSRRTTTVDDATRSGHRSTRRSRPSCSRSTPWSASGDRPLAGLADGRADIVTCQRAIAALAARRGVGIGGEAAA